MSAATGVLQKIDDAVAAVERVLLLVSLAGMTLLVGLDVTQRTFSRPVGRTEALVAFVADVVAGPLGDDARARAEGPVGTAVFVVLAVALFVAAAATMRNLAAERAGRPRPSFVGAIVVGAGAFVGATVAVQALLFFFPSSVPGAQKFALGLMLWAGMLGASLATRERRHIVLDPVVKKLEGPARNRIAFLGGVVAGAFCFVIFVLGAVEIAGEIHEWSVGEGVGVYPSLPIPLWIATLAIPTTFLVMALRFWKNAAHDLRHGPPSTTDAHSVDLNELEKAAVEVAS